MKKILLMAFVSAAMMAMVSCSKDDDEKQESTPPSLAGTLWEANVTYSNVPVVGSGTIEVQLFFKSEGDVCRVDADLPAMIQTLLASIVNLQPGEYPYTFDGEKVMLQLDGSVAELEYTGSTLVFHIPEQYSTIAQYLGGNEVVFNKQ